MKQDKIKRRSERRQKKEQHRNDDHGEWHMYSTLSRFISILSKVFFIHLLSVNRYETMIADAVQITRFACR